MLLKKVQAGFTLIEIMVVMVLLALLMGTVGPMTINQLEKTKAKSDLLSLKSKLKAISAKAAIKNTGITAQFDGKEVTIVENGKESELIFEHVFFKRQTLAFNKNGFVFPDKLNATYRKNELSLDLNQSINQLIKMDNPDE